MNEKNKKKIAIVDSDTSFSELMVQSLRDYGYQVESAATPEAGLDMVVRSEFDLVIIGLAMSGMGGMGFLEKWSEEADSEITEVILIADTASAKPEVDDLIGKSGMGSRVVEVLFKPLVPSQLKSFIDFYFDSKRFTPVETARVMAIDDSKIMCKMYESMLASHDFRYEITDDSTVAEGIAGYFKPDIILMDASMPTIDGFALTKSIKSNTALGDTRIIMVTADSRKDTILKSLSSGAIDILHKPFDEEILLAKMNAHLAHKRRIDELSGAYQHFKKRCDVMESVSITDYLTGLYNHRRLYETMAAEISRARRHGAPLSLIMMDIDFFKSFNDTYGHRVGDEVLKSIAVILQGAVRLSDTAARYGGEEFAVLTPETDLDGAIKLAEKIRTVIDEARVEINGNSLSVTVSLGVAGWDQSMKAISLVEKADHALYESKKSGRNRVSVER